MNETIATRSRRWVSYGLAGTLVLVLARPLVPGLPVMRGPSARAATKQAGQMLFVHEWEQDDALARGDGLGPVFNARSCAACHFQGGVGGSSGNDRNVHTFVALPTRSRPKLSSGLVHAAAIEPSLQETGETLKQLFPIVPGGQRIINGCTIQVSDFDPVHKESINTPALFGAGWIDRMSGRSIQFEWKRRMAASAVKEFQLQFDQIPAGRPRVLPNGRVGKFGWKAQFATLEEFVAAACANELGLGNPLMEQAKPLGQSGYPRVKSDMTRRQFGDLVAFVDTLPRPTHILPADPTERTRAKHGEELFSSIGCTLCHVPNMGGVEGVYSDFLLHRLDDPENRSRYFIDPQEEMPLPDDQPLLEEWKTSPLWGVADSAPYFHDGGSRTLEDAILRHDGSAKRVTDAYRRLSSSDQRAVIVFLQTLKAPPNAPAQGNPDFSNHVVQR